MSKLYQENSIADIREIISKLLLNELGTFKDGKPAIWCEPPSSPDPGNGLHVYITRFPQQFSNNLYCWKISLVQYDRSREGVETLEKALKKMRRRFPRKLENHLPTREDIYPQINFVLFFERYAYSEN